jgi:hypothetical protein
MATTSLARRLRLAAVAALLTGAVAAGSLWYIAERSAEPPEFAGGSVAEAREMQQLERIGGKAAVMVLRFQRGFESLWHGERLALSVGVLSLLVAALCLHLAALSDEDDQ